MPALILFFASLACGGPRQGPVSGASADPNAAAAATARGDWRDAADRWYAVYVVDQGRDPRAILETSRALLNLGDEESANNMIDLGLRRHAENPDLLEMKADILVTMGFRRPAERYYQRVIDKEPDRRSALLAIGRARIHLGLEADAVAPLREVVRLSGGDYESYSLLARALKGSGNPGGSYVAWKHAFEYPGATVDDMLSASALALDPNVRRLHPGAATESCRWLQNALAFDPQCSSAHIQLGLVSEETGEIDAAIQHYRRAVELDPSCLVALTNLAILYSGRADEVRTREMVQRALQFEVNADRRRALLRLLDPFDRKADEKP